MHDGLTSLGTLRLVDEIAVPAAARHRRVPWHEAYRPHPPRRGGRGPRGGGGPPGGDDPPAEGEP